MAGCEARVVRIEDAIPERELDPGPQTLMGVLSPAHGFTAPWSVIRFVLGLCSGRGTHAFVCFTRAGTRLGPLFLPGLDGTAGYLVALILALKGYAVRGVIPSTCRRTGCRCTPSPRAAATAVGCALAPARATPSR